MKDSLLAFRLLTRPGGGDHLWKFSLDPGNETSKTFMEAHLEAPRKQR
jgi:hypothetical protein